MWGGALILVNSRGGHFRGEFSPGRLELERVPLIYPRCPAVRRRSITSAYFHVESHARPIRARGLSPGAL